MPPPYNETLLISKFGPPNYKFNTQTASPPGPTPFHYVLFDTTVAGVDQRTVDQYTAYIDRVIASGWVQGAHWMCIFSSPYYLVILTDDWNPSAPPLGFEISGRPIPRRKGPPPPPPPTPPVAPTKML